MTTNGNNEPSFFARYIDDQRQPAQQHNDTSLGSQWAQENNIKTFLANLLANGPMLTTAIEEQGAVHGFNKRQLIHAKEQIGVVAFKQRGRGKFNGPWFWTLTRHTPDLALAKKSDGRYIRYLRDLSKSLGFRLQPIDKYPNRTNKQRKRRRAKVARVRKQSYHRFISPTDCYLNELSPEEDKMAARISMP